MKCKAYYIMRVFLLSLCLGATVSVGLEIQMTTIGNPGNEPDHPGLIPSIEKGAVDYTYQISTYEITVAQYTDFLNHKAASDPHGLYHTRMADPLMDGGPFILRAGGAGSYTYTAETGRETQPVRMVSFYDGLRLANWMHNGQGGGGRKQGSALRWGDGALLGVSQRERYYPVSNGPDDPQGSEFWGRSFLAGLGIFHRYRGDDRPERLRRL